MLHRSSRRRRYGRWVRRLGVLVLGSLLVGSVIMGTPAGAVSGTASGYWSNVPVGPGVPSKGMWVAADPAGPVAIAAVRLTLDEGEASPVILSLKLDRQLPDGAASIYACPTTGAWQPAEAGSMSAAPKYDCTKARVVGVASGDGARLVFDASSLVTSTGLDVVLVPAPASNPLPAALPAPPPSTATFSATFQPFAADQVSVLSAPVAPAPSPSSSGAESAPSPVAPAVSRVALPSAPPLPPVSTVAAAPSVAVAQAAPPPAPRPQAAAPAALSAPGTVQQTARKLSTTARLLLGAILLGLLAWEFVEGAGARGAHAAAPARPPLSLNDVPPPPRKVPIRTGKPIPIR